MQFDAERNAVRADRTVAIGRYPRAAGRVLQLHAAVAAGRRAALRRVSERRRLAERDVPFVQLYHMGWDQHGNLPRDIKQMCKSSDQASAALIKDLKQRGLLEDTLVVWGGEFGRTPMSEKGDGRDHNPTGFTMWMAGGGTQSGQTIGATDELGLYAMEDKMHVHDIHATIMAMLGLDQTEVVYMH